MTLFQHDQLRDAFLFSESGNQALLLCKKRRGHPQLAWLIDNNTDRLWSTARRLGLRFVHVQRANQVGQHVVLGATPLDRAMAECAALELAL